jgi:hypothetical protein
VPSRTPTTPGSEFPLILGTHEQEEAEKQSSHDAWSYNICKGLLPIRLWREPVSHHVSE